jgi:hypothetical protein
MASLAKWRTGIALAAAGFCIATTAQEIPSFAGRVQKVGGIPLPHVTVLIEGAGSTETSDSGDVALHLNPGFSAGQSLYCS